MPDPKPRRPKGSGTTFRLPDGRYAHQATVPPLPGQSAKRPRLTRYGKTAAEARKRVAAAILERQRQATAAQHVTVADYLARWLRDAVRPVRRPRTIEGYEGALRRYVLPPLGALPLADLKPGDLQRVYATLQTAGLHSTASLVHTILHAAFRAAVRWELLDRNPADRVERPKPRPKPRQALTRDQAGRLIAALADHPDEALYLVALTTGMRAGELLGLHWPAVDWQAGTIHVGEQVQWIAGKPEPGPPKSLSRLVPVPPFVLAALRRHQERQQFLRLSAGPCWQEQGLVFPTATGSPQWRGAWLVRWRKLAEGLGLPRLSLHEIRHSAVTLARQAGASVEVVSAMAGHSSVAITLGVYRHVQPSDREAMRQQLEDFLAPPEPSPEADSDAQAKP